MKICYYDESGDDGFPRYSSPLFVLSAIYLDHLAWKHIHGKIAEVRRELKQEFDFPIKMEMHTKQFLLDKSPYRERSISESDRIRIMNKLCSFIGDLDISIINILINKTIIKKQDYDVLNTALKFSVQRIENDIDPKNNPDMKFLIITDEGRVGKMRKPHAQFNDSTIYPPNSVVARFGRRFRPLSKTLYQKTRKNPISSNLQIWLPT